MKQPSYDELWLLAFVDKKFECFNKNYFDYYIRKSKEYKECSVITGTLEELRKIGLGLIFHFDDKFFSITSFETDYTGKNMIKKFRVDPWGRILCRIKSS